MVRPNRWQLALALLVVVGAIGVATVWIRSDRSQAAGPQEHGIEFQSPNDQGSGDAVRFGTAEGKFASSPRQLNPSECTEASRRMDAQAQMLAESIGKQAGNQTLMRGQLSAAVEESRGWFAAGCPKHPVLGYYEAVDGSGALKSVLIDFP